MDIYDEVVDALDAMMAAPRDERTDLYQTAAYKILRLRSTYGGVTPDYRAAFTQACREAGVPSDEEDTVQAALRYHIQKAKTAPAANSSSKSSPSGRLKALATPEPPTRLRKALPPTDGQTMPTILADALEDPVGLVRHAIRALEAARNLKPRGDEAETVRYMLRALGDAVSDLASLVDHHYD